MIVVFIWEGGLACLRRSPRGTFSINTKEAKQHRQAKHFETEKFTKIIYCYCCCCCHKGGGGGVSQEESLNEVLKAQLPIIFSDSQWQLMSALHWYKVSTGRVIEILMSKIMTFSFFKRFWYHSVENTLRNPYLWVFILLKRGTII